MKPTELGLSRKPFVYLASPLFSTAEKRFNEELASALSRFFTVYLPQRDGGLFVEFIRKGFAVDEAAQQVFAMDTKALESAHYVFAVLDGRTIDEGVALELGYAYALGKPCYGLQTDPRRLLPVGNNPMISSVLKKTVASIDELLTLAEVLSKSVGATQDVE